MYIAIDLGGSKTRIASSENLAVVKEVITFASSHDLNGQRAQIQDALTRLEPKNEITGICIGVPGVIERASKRILRAPNFPELDGLEVANLFPGIAPSKVYLENDAQLGGLGEAVSGAGYGTSVVAYLALGTGVGGSCIENGVINKNRRFSEPGHVVMNYDDVLCDNIGYFGSLESYISGTNFEKVYGCKSENCLDRDVWIRYGSYLGIGILNITLLWGPGIVVLGGGISEKYDYFIDGVNSKLKEYTSFETPKVVQAVHKDLSGIMGCLAYFKQNSPKV